MTALPPSVRLTGMLKEWNARDNAYMIADRRGEWLLLGQRLPLVASFINSSIARDKIEHVSVTGLYECKDRPIFHKLAWKVEQLPLEAAAEHFERARREGFANVCIIGVPTCYRFERM